MPQGALSSPGWGLGKEIWPQKSIVRETYKADPLVGMIKKDSKFGETFRHIAVKTGTPQGLGPDFSEAKRNKSYSAAKVFAFSPKKYYALFSVENLLLEQSKIADAVIVDAYTEESEGALEAWNRDLSAFMYGNGGGAFARIASIGVGPDANKIVLTDPLKARFFAEDMNVTLSATDGTSGAIKPGTPLRVIGVEDDDTADAGTITFSSPVLVNFPTAAPNDFLFRSGVFGNVINGLAAWLPPAKPGTAGIPGTFLGVDRTLNSRKYAGFRVNCLGLTFYEAGMKAATMMVNASAKPDTWVMNPNDWNVFRSQLEGAGNLVRTTAPSATIDGFNPGMNYEAIELTGPKGKIKVVAGADCPSGRSYMLQLDTWTLASVGPLVQLIDSKRTEENSDSQESRFAGYLEAYCKLPGNNATLQHVPGA